MPLFTNKQKTITLLRQILVKSNINDVDSSRIIEEFLKASNGPEQQEVFTGILDLSNPSGTLYPDYTQTGALTLSVGSSEPGGWAVAKITANGSAINIPGAWIQFGGDSISTTASQVNHLHIFYKDSSTVYYTNKVI